MSHKTVRVNSTIPVEIDAILERWCSMTGASKSKVISMMLQNSMPPLAELMDKVEKGESFEELTQAIVAITKQGG